MEMRIIKTEKCQSFLCRIKVKRQNLHECWTIGYPKKERENKRGKFVIKESHVSCLDSKKMTFLLEYDKKNAVL